MAIGTLAAIGIGLAGAGSAASAISSNSASKRAAQTSQQTTDANNALAREIYGQNRQIMSPFVNRGNAAGNQINALLGLGGGQQMWGGGPATATMTPNALSQFAPAGQAYGIGDSALLSNDMGGPSAFGSGFDASMSNGAGSAYLQANPDVAAEFQRVGAQFNNDPNAFAQFHYSTYGQNEGRAAPAAGVPTAQGGMTAQQAATNAFDIFKQSTGYQNRFNSALDGVSSAFAGIGGFQSGAAAKALQDRAGQVAGEEFANYMNALGNQQAVGAGAGSALAGVGQNFAGSVMNNNSLNAQNQMSAQLSRQSPLGNIAGILGGGLLSYGTGGTRR